MPDCNISESLSTIQLRIGRPDFSIMVALGTMPRPMSDEDAAEFETAIKQNSNELVALLNKAYEKVREIDDSLKRLTIAVCGTETNRSRQRDMPHHNNATETIMSELNQLDVVFSVLNNSVQQKLRAELAKKQAEVAKEQTDRDLMDAKNVFDQKSVDKLKAWDAVSALKSSLPKMKADWTEDQMHNYRQIRDNYWLAHEEVEMARRKISVMSDHVASTARLLMKAEAKLKLEKDNLMNARDRWDEKKLRFQNFLSSLNFSDDSAVPVQFFVSE